MKRRGGQARHESFLRRPNPLLAENMTMPLLSRSWRALHVLARAGMTPVWPRRRPFDNMAGAFSDLMNFTKNCKDAAERKVGAKKRSLLGALCSGSKKDRRAHSNGA
jgi:hypothetical protein